MMPNGVGTGSPPAKFLPPRNVWQAPQLPIAASSRPCLTSAASKDFGAGGSIGAIAGRHAIANAAAVPPTSRAATRLAIHRDFVIRPGRFSQRLLERDVFRSIRFGIHKSGGF